jgi:hypothetical protein
MELPQGVPDSDQERALFLQNLLITRARGEHANDVDYRALRKHFMESGSTKDLLPTFVRSNRDLASFWGWIKSESPTYAGRARIIREAFVPLLDYVEGKDRAPLDKSASETLASFDVEGVHAVWEKALARRANDSEGAITAARTLLETVCKHILDAQQIVYGENDDLPKLYNAVARSLNLAPSQHTEEAFRRVLGGAASIVEGLGTIRNRIGDSHGSGRRPVRPIARHAHLVVNVAGSMATFLVETWLARTSGESP